MCLLPKRKDEMQEALATIELKMGQAKRELCALEAVDNNATRLHLVGVLQLNTKLQGQSVGCEQLIGIHKKMRLFPEYVELQKAIINKSLTAQSNTADKTDAENRAESGREKLMKTSTKRNLAKTENLCKMKNVLQTSTNFNSDENDADADAKAEMIGMMEEYNFRNIDIDSDTKESGMRIQNVIDSKGCDEEEEDEEPTEHNKLVSRADEPSDEVDTIKWPARSRRSGFGQRSGMYAEVSPAESKQLIFS
jgi:hypothetical protein